MEMNSLPDIPGALPFIRQLVIGIQDNETLCAVYLTMLYFSGFDRSVPSPSVTPVYDLLLMYTVSYDFVFVQVMLSSASVEKRARTVNKVWLLVTRMNRQSLS